MSGRKETPDPFEGALFGRGKSLPENGKASSRHDVIAAEEKGGGAAECAKPFKLTSYIDADLNDEADLAVVRLKKRVGKVSKSMLVEAALRICLADPAGSGLEAALKERNGK
ncbi:hypothetical protein [Maridesulfovibrio sp. FT414]|uniref:hypothetical protein n=1 Tax=Maridesulfovibrio sp. FT414 TaxID=2979469 RepID=UPI003D807EFB